MWLLDYYVIDAGHRAARRPGRRPFAQLFDFDAETMQNALGSLSQVIAAVLGIAITVVSIVVQLAATRYTSRVADMFFRDRINLGVMGFFVVACVEALWVSFTVRQDYVPQATITATVHHGVRQPAGDWCRTSPTCSTSSTRRRSSRASAAETLERATSPKQTRPGAADRRRRGRRRRSAASRNLADIAVNALGQKDKVIATDASAALRRLLVEYQRRKGALDADWFAIGAALRADPDFVALAADSLDDLASRRTWLEWKGLRQIREVFGAALTTMPEMAHVVAIDTRYVGEAALAASATARCWC